MRWLRLVPVALLLSAPATSFAQVPAVNSLGPIAVTPASSPPCPSVTGTLANAGDAVSFPSCPGISSFRATVTLGSTPLTGTIQASDPANGLPRSMFKGGVGELDVSSVNIANGTAGQVLEYRFVAFEGIKITLTAVTSGTATVKIDASTNPAGTYQNNPIHTSIEGALRNGRAFTATTGIQAVAAGNFISLLFSIPSTANYRAIIYDRILNCNQATATTPGEFYGVSNPTANLTGGTGATITNRRTGGAASLASVSYFMATSHPDTNPASTLPPGGFLKTGGDATTLGEGYMRTVEPGTSFVNWIGGSGGGLTAASRCYITYLWYEETVN